MAIKRPFQYYESLKDDRVIWYKGKRVTDVTNHPELRAAANVCAVDYILAEDSNYRSLAVIEEAGQAPYHFTLKPPTTGEDLKRRREYIQTGGRICLGGPTGAKFTGIDALHAITATTAIMDKELGTNYASRVEAFRESCKKNDLAISVCMTDVKGDRTLRPSQQKDHQDYYVHIVEERDDGIVVSGAKNCISMGPVSNEIVVMPCRAMKEEDKAYSVAFAVTPDTEGMTFFPARREGGINDNDTFDHARSARVYHAECLLVFENVFIPKERVFMQGEWQFSGPMTYMFANFHRISADSYKGALLEMMAGAATLMAEYNGLSKVSHIQDKIAWLVWYAETAEALGSAACANYQTEENSGMVYPNSMISNAAKFFFADNFHQAMKNLVDIGGGILVSCPSSMDFNNPETNTMIRKYLAGKDGIPTEHRLRMARLITELVSVWEQLATIHAEGSLASQKLSFLSLGDFNRYTASAKRAAGIDDGTSHPVFADLPSFPK